ncbi:SMP-30/gluconolactonase/LRE family protein [Micromonospora sp. 4G57]|uniref:SMP-30/gluconolactonase/LRE family protein n=1 Tax=Micromonospora sicca TaxID=2202420 RepID=A0ABU5JBD8_9ACTN|nr:MULTISPECIES: SMP-30/gluconolactonase/LRE family protein [unclassified Micromonospora]MDZ5441516.1 SMP-30/gluconolactonase/LRE family protein [Micromonospora sp. 4G57]MDZ5489913.1 SMP-30/gluconolactonase/LRE family protein [Micromonospora sp. 4G53]
MTVTQQDVDWALLGELRCALGESPIWDDTTGRLHLVDVAGRTLWVVDPTTGAAHGATCGRPVTALVPRAGSGWLGVAGRDLGALDPQDGTFRPLVTVPGPADLSLNDAVCGRDGQLYVGSVDRTRANRGALYSIGAHLRHRILADRIGASNGVDTSPDGRTLYHADTFADTVTAYESDGRAVASVRVDHPDGITVDADGGVWVALWGSGLVVRHTAGLVPDRALRVPAPLVTNLAFGGPDLRRLFVTTGRSDGAEFSGAVFTAEIGVCGLPPARFAAGPSKKGDSPGSSR